jgi:hypothetical protein
MRQGIARAGSPIQHNLNILRATALAFPHDRRYPELSFEIHRAAGDPDVLDYFIEKHGTAGAAKLDMRQVKRLRDAWPSTNKPHIRTSNAAR